MRNRGFTLMETVIYLALFTIVIGGIVVAAYLLFESADRNQTKAMLQQEKDFVMAKIVHTFIGAQAICFPGAGLSGSILSVSKFGGSCGAPDSIVDQASSDVRINNTVLNNSNVSISNLSFIHTYSGGSNPDSVEIGFTISTRTPKGILISQTASTTKYLHK